MKKSKSVLLAAIVGAVVSWALTVITLMVRFSEEIDKKRKLADKHLELFLFMNEWVQTKQRGGDLANYFVENNYQNIAVYGLSYMGETFLKELEDSNVNVVYGIDENIDAIYIDIILMTPDDELPEVDAIIVTPITFFAEIAERLQKKINCPIISLETVLKGI